MSDFDWGSAGLSEEQQSFVTEKGFGGVPDLVDAVAKQPGWLEGVDKDLKGAVEAKGFKDPSSLAKAYLDLEKYKGVPPERLIQIPEKDWAEDPASWEKEVFSKMGRPEAAENYKIEPTEDATEYDKKLVDWAKKTFFELGLSETQATKFYQKWNELSEAQALEWQEKAKEQAQEAERELKTKWGMKYLKNKQVALGAATEFGVTEQELGTLKQVWGEAKAYEFFQRIGEKMGEDTYIDGSKKTEGLLSPEAAVYKLEELRNDKEFMNRWMNGDVKAKQEINRLVEMSQPG